MSGKASRHARRRSTPVPATENKKFDDNLRSKIRLHGAADAESFHVLIECENGTTQRVVEDLEHRLGAEVRQVASELGIVSALVPYKSLSDLGDRREVRRVELARRMTLA